MELVGSITRTIRKTTELLQEEKFELSSENKDFLAELKTKFENITKLFKYNPEITHPLQLM